MKIHILGIGGTFMAGIATLAIARGDQVTGSDKPIYPPMSEQLAQADIHVYDDESLEPFKQMPDLVIIGNTCSRGHAAVEYVLRENLAYISGAQWLAENILANRQVIAVAGTHGKTTTASMLAWVLKDNHIDAGFMIGGIPENFGVSVELGTSSYFVIEADEYDTAFFDKRSKFVHYHPKIVILNNLEFDHIDIFPNLAAIQTQFHHLIRTIPDNGLIIRPAPCQAIDEVMQQGCWTETEIIGAGGWSAKNLSDDGSEFDVYYREEKQTTVQWSLIGQHNIQNALAVFAVACHLGVKAKDVAKSLKVFKNVKRRMEICGVVNGVTVYDDFAHHPTAIQMTLEGLRARVKQEKIFAVVEIGSQTMRSGAHHSTLLPALSAADDIVFYTPDVKILNVKNEANRDYHVFSDVEKIIDYITGQLSNNDHILLMSNRGMGGLHQMLLRSLTKQ